MSNRGNKIAPSDASAAAAPAPAISKAVAQALGLHQHALRLEDEHKYDEAVACELKAVTAAPHIPKIHLELGLFLLRRGEFGPGLREYEWRWKTKDRLNSLPKLGVPQWNGMRLPEGRIALVSDQGAGDKIQFARYIPRVANCFKEVYLTSPAATASLFEGFAGVTRLVRKPQEMPPVDVFCPLSTLPLVFGTTLETIPGDVPYLKADPNRVLAWKTRLEEKCPAGHLRVGISWAGNPTHVKDKWRSTRLDQWNDVFGVPGVSFISLQKQLPDTDRARLTSESRVIDLTSEIGDFSDTAALIENLDLVIAVDTSVVHLAGALAKPAWVLLQWVPDWRWLLNREDSPWYPTLRLFRQIKKDDYTGSLDRVADELRALAAGDRSRQKPPK